MALSQPRPLFVSFSTQCQYMFSFGRPGITCELPSAAQRRPKFGPQTLTRFQIVRVIWRMQSEKIGIILVLLIMCSSFSSAQTQSESGTGIEGVITVGPTHGGPIRADAPSSAPLANATFVVKNENEAVVASFTTDDEGRFRTSLSPGRYTVSMEGKKSGIGKFGPFQVDVVAGKMTRVEWHCDTGMR
jgi:hypothetical protein